MHMEVLCGVMAQNRKLPTLEERKSRHNLMYYYAVIKLLIMKILQQHRNGFFNVKQNVKLFMITVP